MGFFERLLRRRSEGRLVREARARELDGDLAAAVTLFDEAGFGDDAARVLLRRADAESSPEKRLAFAALATDKAESEELRKKALARKALLAFDIVRGRGAAMRAEILAVARELEEALELERAADAYALAGDAEGEVRALTAAGAIDRLEDRLKSAATMARDQRELEQMLKKLDDLDRTAERRAALALADEAEMHRHDARVAEVVRRIRSRLLRGPVVDLEVLGAPRKVALGAEVTIGRGDATIVIASRAVSRRHVRFFRGPNGPLVEDLGTRNGTFLAGARLASPLPVGDGVVVHLGAEVRCEASPTAGGGVTIEIGGTRYEAPLGDLDVGAWRIGRDVVGGDAFVVLSTPTGSPPPFLGEFQLAARVELSAGDAVSTARAGSIALRVLAVSALDEDTQV